jgi:hypothetical protein
VSAPSHFSIENSRNDPAYRRRRWHCYFMAGHVAVAQIAAPLAQVTTSATQPVAPNGYTLHESIDLGGHIANITGSGAMYNTLVNIQSGPACWVRPLSCMRSLAPRIRLSTSSLPSVTASVAIRTTTPS